MAGHACWCLSRKENHALGLGLFLCGRVGEWLKPADCKSAAPCGLRRFECSPVHHPLEPTDIRLEVGARTSGSSWGNAQGQGVKTAARRVTAVVSAVQR